MTRIGSIHIRVKTGVVLDPDDGLYHVLTAITTPDGVRIRQHDPGFAAERDAMLAAGVVAKNTRAALRERGWVA